MELKHVAVFCGSSRGVDPDFARQARQLGHEFARQGITLIYGAGNIGLMGVIADAVLEQGGNVIGVIPHFIKDKEVCHTGLTELILVDTMHQRKQIMAERSDGFIVLPGGFGTLDEFFEILTWKQLHLHHKPIGLLNWKGYYDHLLAHIRHMHREGYLRESNLELLATAAELAPLLEEMSNMGPSSDLKWFEPR
ncbi:MAG: TIGR00730 family Rossman fold protein [Saprospiraceae bacterium]|nr:TIGR00730 family Rossman fold protein [Saprospiraceae bacterium]MCB0677908.1 TIGR00730 family Rossman fold protein [Saprospiraceae bacterium]